MKTGDAGGEKVVKGTKLLTCSFNTLKDDFPVNGMLFFLKEICVPDMFQ